jgi:periplasmic protein TonB
LAFAIYSCIEGTEPIAANGRVTALPIASKGANQYQSDMPETEDLPPHRAAVPVHASIMAHPAAVRRRYVIALSIAFSLALHGGFFAAAMVWGQGEPLPETAEGVSATIQIQVTQEHIRETIAAKPMPVQPGESEEILRIETAPSPVEQAAPSPEALGAAEDPEELGAVEDVVARKASAGDTAAIAEAGPDEAARGAVEDGVSTTQQKVFAITSGHVQPTVAVVASPPAPATPQPPQRVEAAADAKGESYLPPIPDAGDLPEARQETEEESQPRRKRAIRASERSEMANVAPNGGKARRATRHAPASRFAMFAYKRRIRARVMRNLPQGQWGAGRVVIGLRLSRWGELLGTHVARSSGSTELDRAALNCVRMAGPYPRPPAGLTPAQLALSMDFRFE